MTPIPPPPDRPLRVGIDASAAAVPRPTGVGLAIARQCAALRDRSDISVEVLYRLSRLRRRRHFLPGRSRFFADSWTPGLARRLDVFHGPDARLPSLRGPALVATIHDLSAQHGYSTARFRRTREAHWRRVRERARLVVTYTQAVREELERVLGIPGERVAVVPLAAAADVSHELPAVARARVAAWVGEGPYVLCLGELSRRKNTVGALEAFAAAGLVRHRLVLCGPEGYGAEAVEAAVGRLGLVGRVVRPSYLPSAAVASLLRGADALLFPSRYEGFGMPLLEAFRAEVPVVASRAPALLEVSAGAALHADAEDAVGLGAALREAVDPGARAERVARGRERARAFTWERTAARLSEVYRAAAEGRPAPATCSEAACQP